MSNQFRQYSNAYVATNKLSRKATISVHSNHLIAIQKQMEILGADFVDWICDGTDVNEAFKLDEVADLN